MDIATYESIEKTEGYTCLSCHNKFDFEEVMFSIYSDNFGFIICEDCMIDLKNKIEETQF